MRRLLLQSAAFVRAARRLVKKHPEAGPSFQAALESLTEDAFHAALKTHKLKGELAGSWACSAGYDLRIVFELVQHEGTEAILLKTAGGSRHRHGCGGHRFANSLRRIACPVNGRE